jgi:hypothetical protein
MLDLTGRVDEKDSCGSRNAVALLGGRRIRNCHATSCIELCYTAHKIYLRLCSELPVFTFDRCAGSGKDRHARLPGVQNGVLSAPSQPAYFRSKLIQWLINHSFMQQYLILFDLGSFVVSV